MSRWFRRHSEVSDTRVQVDCPAAPRPTPGEFGALPYRPLRVVLYAGAALLMSALVWVLVWVAVRLAFLTVSLAVAVLLAALCTPLVGWLRSHRVPAWLASVVALLLVVGFPVATGLLVWRRASSEVNELGSAVTRGVDDIRRWLVEGPFSLAPGQVDDVRDVVVSQVRQTVPSAAVGATTVLELLAGAVLVIFAVFFLLRDGDRFGGFMLLVVPRHHQSRARGAGRDAWSTLSAYTQGIMVVAVIDAVIVGAALYLLGVPLYLSLGLLTFLAAFVPIVGAVVSGALAVLVTLVTNGGTDALIMAGVVLAVQQLEGNVLSPLIVGRAVRLHPLVVIVAVTAGTLLLGVVGALLAVPILAMAWSVARSLSGDPGPV